MDTQTFRSILQEEIKKAFRKELREIITEAVEIIESRKNTVSFSSNPLLARKSTAIGSSVSEGQSQIQGLGSLLEDTWHSMTSQDLKQFSLPEVVEEQKKPEVSLDNPLFSRVSQIYKASLIKDRERHGN